MNNGFNKKIFFGIIIIILITSIVLMSNNKLSVVDQGDYISIPSYGTLTCEKSRSGPIYSPSNGYEYFSDKIIKCQDVASLVDDCEVTFKMPDKSKVKGYEEAVFLYSICRNGEYCDVYDEHAQQRIILRNAWINHDTLNDEITEHLNNDQYIVAQYLVKKNALATNGYVGDKDIGLVYNFVPYKIYIHDQFSRNNEKPMTGSIDCSVKNNIKEANLLIEGVINSRKLSNDLEVSKYLDINNLRQKGASVSYLTHFVPTIPQYNLEDDGYKYCIDKKLYDVAVVKTLGGSYKIIDPSVNDFVNVECCNNLEVPPGYSCSSNHKIVHVSQDTKCSVFKRCPYENGIATGDKKFLSQECVSGECVTKTINVECNFDSECNGGFCDVNNDDPSKNKCVSIKPLDKCGNGYCELSFGENSQTCPKDCLPDSEVNNGLLTIVLVAVAVVLFLAVLFLAFGRSNNGGDLLG